MKNEKIKKALIWGGILIVLLIALDYLIMPFVVSSEVISVPNITNKHKDEAIRILEAANLSPVLQAPRYDEKTRKDFVVLQKPEPGAMVKKGRRVYLAISGGDEKVSMPNLFGKSSKEAQMILENSGLKAGFVEQTESEDPPFTVVAQQYVPNSSLNKGTTVNYTISMGPAEGMIRVPRLIGKSYKDAESALEGEGLKVGKVEYNYSQSLLPNTVMEQFPSEGTLLAKDGSVDLVLTTVRNNERKR